MSDEPFLLATDPIYQSYYFADWFIQNPTTTNVSCQSNLFDILLNHLSCLEIVWLCFSLLLNKRFLDLVDSSGIFLIH